MRPNKTEFFQFYEKGNEPPQLLGRWIRDLKDLIPIHQKYVGIVQQVARENEATICDLNLDFSKMPSADRASQFFLQDGIHFNEAGNVKVAEFLKACFIREKILEKMGLLPASAK